MPLDSVAQPFVLYQDFIKKLYIFLKKCSLFLPPAAGLFGIPVFLFLKSTPTPGEKGEMGLRCSADPFHPSLPSEAAAGGTLAKKAEKVHQQPCSVRQIWKKVALERYNRRMKEHNYCYPYTLWYVFIQRLG
jgi:hypothetical protein